MSEHHFWKTMHNTMYLQTDWFYFAYSYTANGGLELCRSRLQSLIWRDLFSMLFFFFLYCIYPEAEAMNPCRQHFLCLWGGARLSEMRSLIQISIIIITKIMLWGLCETHLHPCKVTSKYLWWSAASLMITDLLKRKGNEPFSRGEEHYLLKVKE